MGRLQTHIVLLLLLSFFFVADAYAAMIPSTGYVYRSGTAFDALTLFIA